VSERMVPPQGAMLDRPKRTVMRPQAQRLDHVRVGREVLLSEDGAGLGPGSPDAAHLLLSMGATGTDSPATTDSPQKCVQRLP
jgi:hypothetical protein